jgi:hypothetical protein
MSSAIDDSSGNEGTLQGKRMRNDFILRVKRRKLGSEEGYTTVCDIQ